jgi:DNA-binding NtrC family response regulator
LAVLTIHVPPLRERASDIERLTEYFLSEPNLKVNRGNQLRISDEAIAALSRYSWPGNVRQLRHVVERLAVGADDGRIITSNEVSEVLNEIRRFEMPSETPLGYREDESLDEYLARTTLGIYNQLRAVAGNHAEVARMLGLPRNTLYDRVERARRILHSS